jgi:UDP-N-acetylglucosamine 2-epimerase (non-hydrolysing)
MADTTHAPLEPIRLAVVSTSRSDFGLLAPVARAAQADPRFSCVTIITGQHLAADTPGADELVGLTFQRLPRPDASLGLVHQRALLAELRDRRCEVVLVLGDRHELLETAQVVTIAGLVLAHCSGGERTMGAVDDLVRDAVTRLAHLHYPAHAAAGERLVGALGEESRRVLVTGEPGIDTLLADPVVAPAELAQQLGAKPGPDDLCVAVHPVTRDAQQLDDILNAVSWLVEKWPGQFFFSSPNGDPGSEQIQTCWAELTRRQNRCHVLPSLGSRIFRSAVAACGVLVGNSSAGLVEAPSLGTPTVDVGTRQLGRRRGASVVDCRELTGKALHAAVVRARSLRRGGERFENPYGDGHAIPRLLDHLAAALRSGDSRWNILVKP